MICRSGFCSFVAITSHKKIGVPYIPHCNISSFILFSDSLDSKDRKVNAASKETSACLVTHATADLESLADLAQPENVVKPVDLVLQDRKEIRAKRVGIYIFF